MLVLQISMVRVRYRGGCKMYWLWVSVMVHKEGDWGSLRYPEPVHVIWDLRTRINYVTDQKGRALTIV